MAAALVLLAVLSQAGPPAEELERGKNAFVRGEYPRAIELLRPLLYPETRLEAEGQIVQAHRMLAEAYLFQRQNDAATVEFRKLLQLRPDYRFDPLLDPSQVVDFFNAIAREHEAELSALEAKHRAAAEALQRERERMRPVIEKRFLHNSFAISFVPFGAGQFQNGHRRKGWFFLVSESLLGSISAGALITNFALYGARPRRGCQATSPADTGMSPGCPPGQVDHSVEDTSRAITRVQMASGWLFWGVVAWGIADAVHSFTPEVPLTQDHPPHKRGIRVAVAPSPVGPSAWGPSLAFRF